MTLGSRVRVGADGHAERAPGGLLVIPSYCAVMIVPLAGAASVRPLPRVDDLFVARHVVIEGRGGAGVRNDVFDVVMGSEQLPAARCVRYLGTRRHCVRVASRWLA